MPPPTPVLMVLTAFPPVTRKFLISVTAPVLLVNTRLVLLPETFRRFIPVPLIVRVPLLLIIKSVPDRAIVRSTLKTVAEKLTVSLSAVAFAAAIASRKEQSVALHTLSFVSAIFVTV